MQINTAMMEIGMDGPQKAEIRPTREPSFPTAGHVSRELHLLPQRYPYTGIDDCSIHYLQEVEGIKCPSAEK